MIVEGNRIEGRRGMERASGGGGIVAVEFGKGGRDGCLRGHAEHGGGGGDDDDDDDGDDDDGAGVIDP